MSKKISLYIAATPWNFLNSFVFASQRENEESYLMYVDFPLRQENPYLQALEAMGEDSPFIQHWCFHGKFKGVWQKLKQRRNELQQLRSIVAELQPDQVFVGSDRRIEFQCAMTEAVLHKSDAKGIYLDEGLFSYQGRKQSLTWSDRVLDSWLKNLIYPVVWKHPITIGASAWISEGWLLQPEKACPLLREKIPLMAIDLDWYHTPVLQSLAKQLLSAEEFVQLQQPFDVLIILPHPSLMNEQITKQVHVQIQDCLQKGRSFRVKRHPRDEQFEPDWVELPKQLPLELMIPMLHFSQLVAAESTATLTMQLLKPELELKYLESL